jgi:methionine-rich copper-binding protein CopC
MRKFLILLAAALLTVSAIPCASAHGEIVAVSPDQNSNIAVMPSEVWIEFDGNLQTLNGKAINTIEVMDSSGEKISSGDPVITGGKISTVLDNPKAAGLVTVNYRIVSEDGHPVEGSFTFTVSPSLAEIAPTTTAEPEKGSTLSVGGIVMIVFLAVFGIGLLVKRKNEKK